MKILYFGTVCNLESYNELIKDCKKKPSIAPVVFESALLNGFSQNGADIEIHSFPMIPNFPHFRKLLYGGQRESVSGGYTCRWLKTVNIPVLKQFSRRCDAVFQMKKWMRDNNNNGVVFTYSIPPFMAGDILRLAEKNNVKTVAIIPDLLRDMYINEDGCRWVRLLKKIYLAPSLKIQNRYDGYIYLTEAMQSVVAPGKPYIVMEGIADISKVKVPSIKEKSKPRAIMYAGMMHEKYGITVLLDAFSQLRYDDIQLWLFGDGTAAETIKKRSAEDSRIKYFGSVPHDVVLDYERQATLLVNPRNPEELFTEYSFPSKTIEYMLSGTPLLTTRLKGIPEEYFKYTFTADSGSAGSIAEKMRQVLSMSMEELNSFGYSAQKFIENEKNSLSQSRKIIKFLEEVMYGN